VCVCVSLGAVLVASREKSCQLMLQQVWRDSHSASVQFLHHEESCFAIRSNGIVASWLPARQWTVAGETRVEHLESVCGRFVAVVILLGSGRHTHTQRAAV